jgi:hypothetical protein
MRRLIVESYLLLLWVGLIIAFRNLHALHSQVQRREAETSGPDRSYRTDDICHAIDLACVFYPKRVLCLQRSAATTLLLRKHGVRAEMVIGAQMRPFRSHAWVEVNGAVVNDKPYMREIYQILENC